MDTNILNENNFMIFAAKNYDITNCFSDEEFYEDLQKFKYLKRLINRYASGGELKERLILNHIIVINNLFGPIPATKMLFVKMKGFEKYLKPFLVYLETCPEIIHDISEKPLYTSDIPMDANIIERLRKI